MEGDGEGRTPSRSSGKRPESMLAQSFAADLDAMFGLSPVIDGLETNLNQKQANIHTGTSELRELEARLRATEERLAKVSRTSSPSRPPPPPPPAPTISTDEQQQDAGANITPQQYQRPQQPYAPRAVSPLAQKPSYPPERPPTAPSRPPPIPNSRRDTDQMLSDIPGQFPSDMQQRNMSNEYVMVDNSRSRVA